MRWGLNWGEKWIKEVSTNLRSCISSQKQTIENNGKCANNRSGYFFWCDFTSLFFQFFCITAFWVDVKTNLWTSSFLFIAIFQLTPVIHSDCGAHWPNLQHPLLTNLHCLFTFDQNSPFFTNLHFFVFFALDLNNPLLTNLHCFFWCWTKITHLWPICTFFWCWTKIIHFWPICTVFFLVLDQNNLLLTNLHCSFFCAWPK